jgi:hypothetical protein
MTKILLCIFGSSDNIDNIKKIFNANTEQFYYIFRDNNCKNKTIKSVKYKIECIKNVNYLQKFIAECYNNVIEDIVKIKYKQYRNEDTLEGRYLFNY